MTYTENNEKSFPSVNELEEELEGYRRSQNLQLVVENSNSIVLRLDKQGTITFINDFALSFFGFSNEELLGNSVIGTIVPAPESSGRDLSGLFQDILGQPDKYVTTEKENLCKNGEKVWISWINAPLADTSGRLREIICIGNDITKRKRGEEQLRLHHAMLARTERIASVGSWEWDIATDRVWWSDGLFRIFLLDPSQGAPSFSEHSSLYFPEDHIKLRDALEQCVRFGTPFELELRVLRTDNQIRHCIARGEPQTDDQGHIERLVGSLQDITERKKTEEALRFSENHYRAIFETSGTAIIILEGDTTISHVNSNFEELSGYTREEIQGKKSWLEFVHPEDAPRIKEYHYQRRDHPDSTPKRYEHRFIDRNGNEHHLLMFVDLIREANQSVASFIDITERKQMEKRLEEMSLYDSLTGLYNRNFFETEMERFSHGRHSPVGIVVCDLDGLKFVNDTLGHRNGDDLLANASRILKKSFRSSDIVSRIGGDEFAILLPKTQKQHVTMLIQRLRKEVTAYNAGKPKIPVYLSIGYAVSDQEAPNMQHLFREADNRMYREKIQSEQSGRNDIVQGLTTAIEARDFATEGHCDRLQKLTAPLARVLNLGENRINDLLLFARFHDLGKVGIPDRILFKPGSFLPDEYQEMKRHCEIGHRIARSVMDLTHIAEWILKHHERWDGQGYPLGLQGTDIPLECRIIAIGDAYDAMTSNRPYRKAMSHNDAFEELHRCAGTQFDPELTEQFITLLQKSGPSKKASRSASTKHK